VGWNWVHLVLRSLTGLWYQPRIIDDECGAVGGIRKQEKQNYSEKTYPSAAFSTTNPTWLELCSNPGRRGGKSANNRLSYGAVLLWYNAMQSVEKEPMFRRNISPSSSGSKSKPSKKPVWSMKLATCFMLVSCLAYSSTLKMKATYSSEMSVSFQRTAWRHIPAERTLRNYLCENLSSYIRILISATFLDTCCFAYLQMTESGTA
jgi:hypothetical protein